MINIERGRDLESEWKKIYAHLPRIMSFVAVTNSAV
jgi:hypothetical protein